LAFLLKAYKKVPDKDFRDYIRAKQNKYEEGHDLNPDILMTQANNKYKRLVQAQTWNAPSPELQKIMALEATIKQLKKIGKPNNNDNKGKGNSKKGKNKKGKKGDKEDKGKLPAWMSKEPPKRTRTNPRPTTRRSGGGAQTTRNTAATGPKSAMGLTSQRTMTTMPMTAILSTPSKEDKSPGYLSSKQ